ncbi:MAG: hypothetical protein KDD45_15250, partial [Bdellovibrionales bacterium]|nr:hypothetical protein [Bdellovibrionales bacterium]
MNSQDVDKFILDPFKQIPSIEESIEISKQYKIALHPKYTFYWNELTSNQLITFLDQLKKIELIDKCFHMPNIDEIKKKFERLGIEHTIKKQPIEDIKAEDEAIILILNEINTKMLFANLGIYEIDRNKLTSQIDKLIKTAVENLDKQSVEILTLVNEIEIRDKGGTYIGARMGRPEKAKMRKMDGKPHGLFPIGEEGGRLGNIMEAYTKKGKIVSNFAIYLCETCDLETIYNTCEKCQSQTKPLYFKKWTDEKVNENNENAVRFKKIDLDIMRYVDNARSIVQSVELPKLVKGIKETTNKFRVVEHISKSFLRAKNDVFVNKDGTVRFDMIEMGITHFKPKEIGTSLEKLKELGYTTDYYGKELTNDNQLIEIFPQDVILPDNTQSGDELASTYVLNTARFVDELLVKLYNLEPFYNFKTKEDTIGHLVIGLAPHTSAGITGRIIGYSKTQGCFSHPVWHAAQRRNLDGDENGIMLLLDGLINFSRDYLPDRRGARTMDTSLVLTAHLYLDQIDDEVHGMDIIGKYPLELYRAAKKYKSPKEIKIETVEKRINKKDVDSRYLDYKFTHDNNDMNDTVLCSSYKSVPLMTDK